MSYPGVALVTGAGSGIGRATALLFAKYGCSKIVIADIDKNTLEATKKEIESIYQSAVDILAVPTDVTFEDSVNSLVQAAVAKFGRVDYACNVAGILLPGYTTECSAATFDKQYAVNQRGTWLCQKAELTQMLKQEPLSIPDASNKFASTARGAIANVASMAGLRAYDNLPAYCATKSAVLAFTKADGLRHGRDGIRVNAICPGVIKTPMLGEVPDDHDTNIDEMTKEMAMRRQGLPEEVAEALLWIVSNKASFVTATDLPVNGGMIAA
ncbi:NAD(P)-binding protein [Pyrenochaeta sp. DS3sAY3a]|nr:NAD(P)-binding protein [Pyrenochaeta sp. DS3sAY3a]